MPSIYGFFFFSSPKEQKKAITIMLDPAGDAQYTGRKIHDTFERSVTLQMAEQIKRIVEEQFAHVKVVLTRLPGESAPALQHANFANRLNVDFFLTINCYQEKETKPTIYIYQFSYGDSFITKQFDLALIPYDQAHLINSSRTNDYSLLMYDTLNDPMYANMYIVKGIFKIPFKSLIGVKAPALALEIGIKNKENVHDYIQPIIASLTAIIEKIA